MGIVATSPRLPTPPQNIDAVSDEDGLVCEMRDDLPRVLQCILRGDEATVLSAALVLADESARPAMRVSIMQFGGAKLLDVLVRSGYPRVQAIAACAMAHLATEESNCDKMIRDGCHRILVDLLAKSDEELLQQAAALALANLARSSAARREIASAGAIMQLHHLMSSRSIQVRTEAAAALANLFTDVIDEAKDSEQEQPSLRSLLKTAAQSGVPELEAQATRALRNIGAPRSVLRHRGRKDDSTAVGRPLTPCRPLSSAAVSVFPFPSPTRPISSLMAPRRIDSPVAIVSTGVGWRGQVDCVTPCSNLAASSNPTPSCMERSISGFVARRPVSSVAVKVSLVGAVAGGQEGPAERTLSGSISPRRPGSSVAIVFSRHA